MATHAHTTSRGGRVLVGLAVLWGIIGLSVSRSGAQDSELSRATLRGLPGVEVIVANLKPEVERAGLTKEQLQTDVELQLRKAGIRVFTSEESRRVQGQPWLYVEVHALLSSHGLVVYNILVMLNQRAFLE